jgi:hypothetical protein
MIENQSDKVELGSSLFQIGQPRQRVVARTATHFR